jgi:hypothetical protein
MQYDAYNCRQLAEEAQRVSAHGAEAAGAQDGQATSDAVVTTAAVVVFWPAAFLLVATSRMLPSLPVYVDRWTRSSRRQFARNVGFNSGKLRRVMKIAELGGEAPTPRLRGGAAPLRRPRGRPGHHVAAKRLINQCRLPNATACGGRRLGATPAVCVPRPCRASAPQRFNWTL